MGKKEIIAQLETITPLWTGDAWQENKKIRPSSLIGSLRFWFEVICYFSGMTIKEEFDSNKGRFEKEFNEKFNNNFCNLTNLEEKIAVLKEAKIPVPAIVFGTTGWRSMITLKEINYGDNFLSEPNGKIIEKKKWCWGSPSYQGKFKITFLVEEKLAENIFYPLLNFMNDYGYWGGKWNIGYGRLNIKTIEEKENGTIKTIDNFGSKKSFDFSIFKYDKKVDYNEELIKIVNSFTELLPNNNMNNNHKTNAPYTIRIFFPSNSKDNDLKNFEDTGDWKKIIRNLINEKSEQRSNFKRNSKDTRKENEKRHKIFGSINPPPEDKDLPQGSKILPYLKKENEENGKYKGGFISIVDLLNLY